MAKTASLSPAYFGRIGPAQYVNRPECLGDAGECVALWGDRALVSGGKNAFAAAEGPLLASLDKKGIAWRKHMFSGEASFTNAARIRRKAREFKANVIIGVGGGKSLDAAKQAAEEMGLPVVCVPTIAATCAATTALSVIYDDAGEFQKAVVQTRNPSLVLLDPEIITRSPGLYLRAGILDSLAKWYEGRSVWASAQDPSVATASAIQLSEVLYKGQRKHAAEAVRLNAEQRVHDALIQTIDLAVLLTGTIQTLARGTLFTALAHPVHNGLTLMKESHQVLHGLKVGYGIMVQLCAEKCPESEFEDVLGFFRQLGLEPSLKGLNLPFRPKLNLRIAAKAAKDPGMGPLNYHVDKYVIAAAMEELEQRVNSTCANPAVARG
jgi:glycerol dehydrogenase